MEAAVSVENLSFSYPNGLVLKEISFHVEQGEFIGIIGPNGGGKTTLLKLIMGFIKPSAGSIKVLGDSSQEHPIGYVPQFMRFDRQFPISVLEVVLSGLMSHLPWYGIFHSRDKKAALEQLDKVGLLPLAEAPFGTLSGGQAQRVLVARALVSKPKLLLLDEPTASVDAQAQADIFAILKDLKGKMTIMMVTHDLRSAVELVERLFCVQGSLTCLKPEEVCEHFALGLYHTPIRLR